MSYGISQDVEVRLRIMSWARDLAVTANPEGDEKTLTATWACFAEKGQEIYRSLTVKASGPGPEAQGTDAPSSDPNQPTEKQLGKIRHLGQERGFNDLGLRGFVENELEKQVPILEKLTRREASKIIDALLAA